MANKQGVIKHLEHVIKDIDAVDKNFMAQNLLTLFRVDIKYETKLGR